MVRVGDVDRVDSKYAILYRVTTTALFKNTNLHSNTFNYKANDSYYIYPSHDI